MLVCASFSTVTILSELPILSDYGPSCLLASSALLFWRVSSYIGIQPVEKPEGMVVRNER